MKKIFVLDTNVILHNPRSIYAFKNNTVVIPFPVLEEIDNFKRNGDELGRNSREFSREIEKFRKNSKLNLGIGVKINNAGKLLVKPFKENEKYTIQADTVDNKIIIIALNLKEEYPDSPIILVSKDVNVRLKASGVYLQAEDFENDQTVKMDEFHPGYKIIEVEKSIIDAAYRNNYIEQPYKMMPNEFVILKNGSSSLIGISDGEFCKIINSKKVAIFGHKPKNLEQSLAIHLLMDPDIQLVSLIGKAGTGKTFLALLCAMEQVLQQKAYAKILVSRPIMPMGKDLGYLPGSMAEKLDPWMVPIYDNLEQMIGDNQEGESPKEVIEDYVEMNALTYIRGRSLVNRFMIIDEAQNLTSHEIKTIVTRAGSGTKIVLTGDPYQIDNPYLDSTSNGLCYVVEKMKNCAISGHVVLSKGERSVLAEVASQLL